MRWNTYISSFVAAYPGTDGLVDFQNLAYVDCSVRPLTAAKYDRTAMANPAYRSSRASWASGLYYYWEGLAP